MSGKGSASKLSAISELTAMLAGPADENTNAEFPPPKSDASVRDITLPSALKARISFASFLVSSESTAILPFSSKTSTP